MSRFLFALVAIVLLFPAQPVSACGADSDCVIGDRTYRIRMPKNASDSSPVGAIVFAHGYRGSAAGVMRNKSLAKVAEDLGVALIAVDAGGEDWALPNGPHAGETLRTDELAYFDTVLEDVIARFPVDSTRIMASGFSAGAMMVWTLACYRSDSFAGFAPISGTFWAPVPATCTTPPASIVHIHGTSDPTVPLEGRRIQDARQGSVTKALEMYAAFGQFGAPKAVTLPGLECRMQTNVDGDILGFCQFQGGHSFSTAYIRQAWAMFTEAGKL